MMYELDSHSGIAGNIYTRDCLTSKGVSKSLLLPIKNNVKFDSDENHRVNPLDPNDTLPNLVDVIKESVNEMSPIGDLNNDNIDLLVETLLLLYPEELREIKRLELVESIVNKLEEGEYYYVPQELRDDETNTFVPTLITYVTSREGMGAHKNRVMQSIYAAASDLRNLKAAEVPMESGEVGREIEKQSAGKTPEYHDLDPFTLWQIQRENAVGRKDVGIAANSIKAAGALQQHFNLLKDDIKKSQKSKISVDLKFNINGRVIKDSFTRLANTKVSREVFEQQLKGFPANELSLVEGASPIEVATENNNQQVLKTHRHGAAYAKFWENYYRIAATYGIGPDANIAIIQEKLYDSDATLESILQAAGNATIAELGLKRSKDIRFVLVLKSYAETYINQISEDGISYKNARMLDGTNGSQFIDVLYYGLEFEPNVADTLSIFISLATDNAKELKLSKMYGRPELLSLPLAMITLGMDIDEVIDICINLLGPISDELDKSRYEGHVKTDVREIIGNLVDKKVFDKETADSLYKIYDTAQELRALTSFFKVNQGVTAKYSELVLFLQGLSKLKIEASKHAKNLDKTQYPEMEKAIDFDRLFTDSDYQKQLLGEYEATKSCFNVLEIVLGSPHFSQLLRSIQTTTKLIEDSTGKGRIMKELNLSEMFDDKLNKESELKFQNRVLRLVDSYVIEQALHNMSDVSFTAGDLREKFPHFRLDLKKDVIVGLQNSHQIEHFLHFVDKILIPQLKAEYPNNFFFANLTVKEDRQTGLSYWDIPFDPFDAKQSLFTAENLNMAAVAFEEIAPHNLGVRTVSGKDMTIGDIMYLYTLITSRNLIRGSMTCVYQAIKDTSPYLKEVSRQYQIIDKLAQNASMQTKSSDEELLILNELLKNQSAQEISNIVETLRPYVKALRKEDGRDKFTRGTEGNEVVENYSVKEFFLPTLSKGTTHGTFTIDDSNIPNTSKYLANIFSKRAAASLHMSESEFNGVYNPVVRLEKVGNSNSYQLTILMQYSQGENGKVIQLEPYRYTFTPEEGSMPYSVLDSFFDFVTANTSGLTLILSSKGYSGEFKESSIITDETEKENLRLNLNLENSLDNDIFNYCTKQSHRWVKTRKGSSRLINIGNNKENPVRIPMVNADEFSIIDATRLYFLSTHGVMSENQLMVALVNSFLAEDAQISDIYQVYEVLNDSEFIDKVKSSKAALVLIDHLKNQEATESIKRQANIALTKYLRAMSYRDIYYRKDSNMSKLKEGDIFEFDGTEYMYVALTEFGSYVLRKITQLNNPNVPDVLVKIELDLQNEGKKKLSLQILSNLIINDFNHTSYSYNLSTPEPLNIKNKAIQIGDKISDGFYDFYVKDIIYVETSDGKLELRYVVYDIDLDASNLTLKSDSDFATGNWTHQTPDVRINLYNAGAVGDQLLISHFSDELKRWVLQQANPASITIMVNKEYLSISRVNHNNVVTVEGSLIPFSSIQGITISSFSSLNDPRFEMRSHAARIETKYWDEDLSIYLAMPEFKRGFVETERKSDSKYQIYVAAVTDGNGDIQYSLQPGDSDYLGIVGDDTSDVLTGDILYDYKRNILYKVANKQLGIYYKMSRTKALNPVKVNGKDVLTTARREIVQLNDALLKELSLFRVAGSNSVRKVARFKNNSNTASDACDHLLSYLAEKFNTTVELVNDPTDISFAKVANGRIIINMANKPNNVSDSNYILEQGIHEFTHLVLAYLQANYPSLYIELLDKVEQIEGISDEVYKYDVTKREEALVRLITQNLVKNNQWMDSTDGKAAYDALIRAFKYLFDDDTLIPDNSDGFLERSIQSAISVFSDNWKTDIISLLMLRVTDELFNQIRKC